MRLAVIAAIVFTAGCASEKDKQAARDRSTREAVSAESARVAAVPSLPATGKWDELHLSDRLVHAGLAPQALTSERGERYWGVPVLAYRVGTATLYAYVYADSAARRRVTAALDTITVAPAGAASPYPLPHILIVNNNLAVVLVGGSDRQQERVSLAITAGLPAPAPR